MIVLSSANPASAYLLFDGTVKPDHQLNGYGFGAFDASVVSRNDQITAVPASTLGRDGYMAKWDMRSDDKNAVLYTDTPAITVNQNQELWYGFSEYLGSDWKYQDDNWEATGMFLDSHSLRAYGFQFEPGTNYNRFCLNGMPSYDVDLKVQPGIWYDYLYHIKWAYDFSGLVEVYEKHGTEDYTLIYSEYGIPTKLQNDHENIDMSIGVYRAGQTEPQTLYIMDPKIGTERQDVVFGSPEMPEMPVDPFNSHPQLGIFDYFNQKYIYNISELPYSSGNPEQSWKEKGSIRAWIDIVGFRNLSKQKGIYYINDDAEKLAIVQYDVDARPNGYISNLEKTIIYSQFENNLTATLNVVLDWYVIICDDDSCWPVYFHEEASFQDTEEIPQQFYRDINQSVQIIEYDNPVEQKFSVQVNAGQNSSRITITYGDILADHRKKIYHVEQTTKGIFFANESDIDIWDIQGEGAGRIQDTVMINHNLTTIDYSTLNISISDVYGSFQVDHSSYNITRSTFIPESVLFNPVLFVFLATLSIFVWGILFLAKRVDIMRY